MKMTILTVVGTMVVFVVLAIIARAPQLADGAAGKETKMAGKTYSEEELKKRLTPLQYRVTRESGTEPPFDNKFWNEHREGLYVDIISGEPLFTSRDKFDSGTGWPSFTKPVESSHVAEKRDIGFGMIRTEVRSREADSHLGHGRTIPA